MKKLVFFFLMCMCSFSMFASSPKLDALLNKAQSGNAKAQYRVGWHYANVEHDYSKAIEWLSKSAEKYVPAQYYLGWCYYYGKGVETNVEQAQYWYEKASQGKDKKIAKEAKAMLKAINIEM